MLTAPGKEQTRLLLRQDDATRMVLEVLGYSIDWDEVNAHPEQYADLL